MFAAMNTVESVFGMLIGLFLIYWCPYNIVAGFLVSSKMLSKQMIELQSYCMISIAIVTCTSLTLFHFRAAYGRYYKSSWFLTLAINARVAWFIQELPSLIVPFIALYNNTNNMNAAKWIVFAMFTGHYFHRTLIYPVLIKGGKPTPPHIMFCAFVFCLWNGIIQSYYHVKHVEFDPNHNFFLRSYIGIAIYFIGLCININSDSILRSLRRNGSTDYGIPYGGMFEYVSCANYFGEIVEWLGYAIYCWTTPSMAFALFTMANIVPRAGQHHEDYCKRFAEKYPKNRRIIIPFIY